MNVFSNKINKGGDRMNKYNIYNFLVYSDIHLPCLPINDSAFKERD